MNFITFSPSATASWELYGMPIRSRLSAQPITPKPIFRVCLVTRSMFSSGYLFASITLSRKWTASFAVRSSFFQSKE